MLTRYSHSADTLCLSIRALRLSGEEAPANSGSLLSPEIARWNHVGWRCMHEKAGPQEPWGLTSLHSSLVHSTRVPQHLRHTWGNSDGLPHDGSELPVVSTQKGWNVSVESLTQVTLAKWCSTTCWLSGIWAGASAVSQLFPEPEWKWTCCQLPHMPRVPFPHSSTIHSVRRHWFSASQHTELCHVQQLILTSQLDDIGKAHITNQYRFTGERFYSWKIITPFIDSLSIIS